jgi:endonuclease/exonuclease/phosphatase family metal-dependent hydrolase
VRVLSYNILKGGEDRLPLIRDVIRAQEPDVVALQEANDRGNLEALAHELGMQYVYGEANAKYSVAWLSRLPIVRSANHRHPDFRKTALEVVVEWGGAPLRLFNVHLKAKIDGEEQRVREVAALLEIVGDAARQPHLVVGDFNALAPGDTYRPEGSVSQETAVWAPIAYGAPRLALPPILAAGYVDCYRSLHRDHTGYTCRTEGPSVRIDYCFAPPGMIERLRGCDVVDGAGAIPASDHFPVWAEFA